MSELELYIEQIKTLCKQCKVKSLYAFGSVLTDSFNKESDIDMIVDFDKVINAEYADNYFNLKFSLENIFHKPVVLLEEKAIHNPFFRQNIDAKKQLIYGHY